MPDLYVQDLARMTRPEAEAAIRQRVQTAYMGDGVTLARVLGRYKMFLRNGDLGFACHVMLDGYWEIWLTLFVAGYLKPGMTVIDVGANFGYYSLLLADCVGPTGRVIAVEPNPDTAALLADTLALNGFSSWTRLERCALGREPDGVAQLFIPQGEPKNSTILAVSGRPGRSVDVRLTSIDALARGLDRIDFIKIDAEGSEAEIVAGMAETLARHRPALVVEFNGSRLRDPAATLERLLSVYGADLRHLTFEGELATISADRVISSEEDLLLFFS